MNEGNTRYNDGAVTLNVEPRMLLARLQESLPAAVYNWLQQAVDIAAQQQVPIYLVGGPVRDLLLGHASSDLDLVVEGDAWPIAEVFAATTGGKLTKHEAFRTATVERSLDGAPFAIDFVTARRETYPTPAALPVVAPSDIHNDLLRRDFTINAVALQLKDGALLDPYNGLQDVETGLVRVLHDRSFIDDPTRIVRGARFAARLRFMIEPHTRELVAAALNEHMIERTSPQRMLNELWLLLSEPQPEQALQVLHEVDALEQLGFVWSAHWLTQFATARTLHLNDATSRTVQWGLLIWPLHAAQRQALWQRYNLPGAERKLLRELPLVLPSILADPTIDALALEQLLRRYDMATLHTLRIVAPKDAAANIARYLDHIRPLPPLLTGADLRTLDVPPGPRYGQLLDQLRSAQLTGTVGTRDAALAWITEQIAHDKA